MEDAYDITSFNVIYDKDNTKVEFKPEDGYAWGSIESKYYGFKWDKATKTATNDGGDQYGNYNRTIFQWTNNIVEVDSKAYREPEETNFEIISSSPGSKINNIFEYRDLQDLLKEDKERK